VVGRISVEPTEKDEKKKESCATFQRLTAAITCSVPSPR